ncbi:phytochrome sensor protein [Pseudomonas kairouanensis]|uniref:Phytochrome sensor protein n=1 Tax=Pseudomonas kairouanensis TaxID=2293832 RepID=A0A4Z0ALB1_9PSED|nr:fimbria/pilus periplasmic chaperone [Pseudomonas kairouanensis]TFY87546.1 phytochrome sensor protein [Pseudomonas kairouanensis]
MNVLGKPSQRRVACAVVALLMCDFVMAGIIVTGTRHIYPERQREITILLTNDDPTTPRLVQAWIERADKPAGPEASDVPFSLSPPVFRIDASKGQAMRLVYTREPLPGDRESLFWLNVLEVPPTIPTRPVLGEAGQNYLRFAFRIRTKVFFRPDKLPGKPEQAIDQLRWSLQQGPEGAQLQVHNASNYYVTFNEVALTTGTRVDAPLLPCETGMVAPGASLTLAVHRSKAAVISADAQVQFKFINDYGAFSAPQRASLRF